MRKTIPTILGALVIAGSAVNLSKASAHHMRQAYRGPVTMSQLFRNPKQLSCGAGRTPRARTKGSPGIPSLRRADRLHGMVRPGEPARVGQSERLVVSPIERPAVPRRTVSTRSLIAFGCGHEYVQPLTGISGNRQCWPTISLSWIGRPPRRRPASWTVERFALGRGL